MSGRDGRGGAAKRPRAKDGDARAPKTAKMQGKRGGGAFRGSARRTPLEEDVLLGGGGGGGDDFMADYEDENVQDGDKEVVVAPEDLETAEEKRLRMAKSMLQSLARDVRKSRGGGAVDAEEDDDMDGNVESSSSEDEEEKRGITRSETFDLVSEKLRARHLSASGAHMQPLSYVLAGHAWGQGDVLGRKGHELSATCVAVSADGAFAYTGSKDCSLVRWRINATAWTRDAVSSGSGSASSDSPSSGVALAGADVLWKDALYPGRRRTKADVERQQAQARSSKKGKGVIPVYGPGFGGGRAGPTPADGRSGDAALDGSGGGGGGPVPPAPRIIHGGGGTSTLIVPSKMEVGPDGEVKGISRKAAITARLRGLPDYGIGGHHGEVLALAVSSDGQYLASGGKDRVVRLWEATPPYVPAVVGKEAGGGGGAGGGEEGTSGPTPASALSGSGASSGGVRRGGGGGGGPQKSLGVSSIENFVGHKDSVTGLAWRPGSHELVSVGADRLLKLWSADELSHVDTLFGHQSDITSVDMPPSGKERAVTASRDVTAQVYKIPEASRLVFRGSAHHRSLEVVRAVSDTYFVTGAQDGALCLWHVARKKPVATVTLAHGTGIHVPLPHVHAPADVVAAASARKGEGAASVLPVGALARSEDGPQPDGALLAAVADVTGADVEGLSTGYCNWVSSIAVCPNSDVIATGSGDGFVRFWRLTQRGGGGAAPPKAVSAATAAFTGLQLVSAVPVKGIVNGLAFSGDGKYLVAAVGTEHRLGRWWRYKDAKNGPLLVRMPTMPAQ